MYVVEELNNTFISKDTLADMSIVPGYFQSLHPDRDMERGMGSEVLRLT